MNRRYFLERLGYGAAAVGVFGRLFKDSPRVSASALSPYSEQTPPASPIPVKLAPPARVSLIKGSDRKQIIFDSLKKIEDDVFAGIGDKNVLIKPNMAVSKNPLAVTHVDAVRAVLEFLRPWHKRPVFKTASTLGNLLLPNSKNK